MWWHHLQANQTLSWFSLLGRCHPLPRQPSSFPWCAGNLAMDYHCLLSNTGGFVAHQCAIARHEVLPSRLSCQLSHSLSRAVRTFCMPLWNTPESESIKMVGKVRPKWWESQRLGKVGPILLACAVACLKHDHRPNTRAFIRDESSLLLRCCCPLLGAPGYAAAILLPPEPCMPIGLSDPYNWWVLRKMYRTPNTSSFFCGAP